MLKLFRKTLAICLIGFGLGILLVLLLPITGWLFIIGVVVVCVGFMWLACQNIKEGDTYDSCSKESTKIFKRICKINIWN